MENVEIRNGVVDAGQCISEGWESYKANFGVFFGVTIVGLLIIILVGLIPYVGSILAILVSGALLCGIYNTMVEAQNQPASFSSLFKPFGQNYVAASLVYLVMILPSLIFGLTAGFAAGFSGIMQPGKADGIGIGKGLPAVFIVTAIIVWILSFSLSFFLTPAYALIADKNFGFKDAVTYSFKGVSANLGNLILLVVLQALVMLGGLALLCIGILFVMPLIYASNAAAYRAIFSSNDVQTMQQPPTPDNYGINYGNPNL